MPEAPKKTARPTRRSGQARYPGQVPQRPRPLEGPRHARQRPGPQPRQTRGLRAATAAV